MASPSTFGLVARMTSSTRRAGDARDQLTADAQVIGTNALQRSQDAVQDVIAASEATGSFDRQQIGRMRNHTQQPIIAGWIAAHLAGIVLGQVHTPSTGGFCL